MENLKEILHFTNVLKLRDNTGELNINGITTDTREDCSGKLFIPLKGHNFDGHNYIGTAFSKGAVAALSEKESNDKRIIHVKNTLQALGDIAKYFIERDNVKIIAVCGTSGKTTVKELLKHVTGFRGTEKNFNNLIGVPKTVIENVFTNKKPEYLILELGINQKGEMKRLKEITTPEYVIFTNISYGHLEGFGSINEVFKEKLEILSDNTDISELIINSDILSKTNLIDKSDYMQTFGETKGVDARLLSSDSSFNKGNIITFEFNNKIYKIASQLLGKFNAFNVIATFLAAKRLGFNTDEIIGKLENFKPVAMRGEILKSKTGAMIINDCYNANYDSFLNAINLFDSINITGKKYIVIGDMFELGNFSEKLHIEIGKALSDTDIDFILGYGNLIEYTLEHIDKKSKFVKKFNTKKNIVNFLNTNTDFKDAILIKASRGVKLEEITEGIKQ